MEELLPTCERVIQVLSNRRFTKKELCFSFWLFAIKTAGKENI